jgi:hypothetical protein
MMVVKKHSMNKSLAKTPYSGICNLTTTFFTPMTPGRPGFGLVLVQVDPNVEMVDQDNEEVDIKLQSLVLFVGHYLGVGYLYSIDCLSVVAIAAARTT